MRVVILGIATIAVAGFALVECVLTNSIGEFIITDAHVVSGENSKIGSFWSVHFSKTNIRFRDISR